MQEDSKTKATSQNETECMYKEKKQQQQITDTQYKYQ